MEYVCQKFGRAVDILATSRGDLQTRVYGAFVPGLLTVQRAVFVSPDLQEKFNSLYDSAGIGDGRELQSKLAEMSEDQLSAIATKIFDIYNELMRLHPV